jgi:hypothetical protein
VALDFFRTELIKENYFNDHPLGSGNSLQISVGHLLKILSHDIIQKITRLFVGFIKTGGKLLNKE